MRQPFAKSQKRTLIIFDFDDTLVFGTNKCFFDALESVFLEDHKKVWSEFIKGEGSCGYTRSFVKWLRDKYGEKTQKAFNDHFKQLREKINLPETTKPLLKALRENDFVDLCVLSARESESVFDDIRRYKLSSYFRGVYGNDSLNGFAKPHIESVHMIEEYTSEAHFNAQIRSQNLESPHLPMEHGLGARGFYEKIIFVGDSIKSDMECAKRISNCQPVLLKSDLTDEEQSFLDEYKNIKHVKSHEKLWSLFIELGVLEKNPIISSTPTIQMPTPQCPMNIMPTFSLD